MVNMLQKNAKETPTSTFCLVLVYIVAAADTWDQWGPNMIFQ